MRTNATAAAIAVNALRNKGKAVANYYPGRSDSLASEHLVNYGATSKTRRKRGASGSSSGERLQRVLENDDDSEDGGSPPAWAMREADEQRGDIEDGGGQDDVEEEEEEEESVREAYLRTRRLYILVPLSCLILFLLSSALPSLIWPFSFPQPPSPAEVSRSILLAAALWCLSHCLRVPTFALTSSILPVILSTVLRRRRRAIRERTGTWTPYIHTTLFVTLQEALRLTSFYILELRWSSAHPGPHDGRNEDEQMYVFDRTFRLSWFLALGWALAEVCAGIVQGYEQLALYSDVESESSSASERLDLVENGVSLPLGEHFEEGSLDDVRLGLAGGLTNPAAEERVFQTIPCVGFDSDNSDLKGKTTSRGVVFGGRTAGEEDPEVLDLDAAITHLSNIKAREDLEAIYGAPFVRIPVFVAILQRVDSILLSLGVTLTIGFAYLCDQTRSMNTLRPSSSPESELLGATHWHALQPTFIVLTVIHICLGVLHTPAILSRIGVHVAAYIACLVGLGLVFAGVGMWVGLW